MLYFFTRVLFWSHPVFVAVLFQFAYGHSPPPLSTHSMLLTPVPTPAPGTPAHREFSASECDTAVRPPPPPPWGVPRGTSGHYQTGAHHLNQNGIGPSQLLASTTDKHHCTSHQTIKMHTQLLSSHQYTTSNIKQIVA